MFWFWIQTHFDQIVIFFFIIEVNGCYIIDPCMISILCAFVLTIFSMFWVWVSVFFIFLFKKFWVFVFNLFFFLWVVFRLNQDLGFGLSLNQKFLINPIRSKLGQRFKTQFGLPCFFFFFFFLLKVCFGLMIYLANTP
jgi:hypothetical protein